MMPEKYQSIDPAIGTSEKSAYYPTSPGTGGIIIVSEVKRFGVNGRSNEMKEKPR